MRIENIKNVEIEMIKEFIYEYECQGEKCKPIEFIGDKNTNLYFVIDKGKIVGVIRATKYLYNECHGKIGISIRPKERGKGYGYYAASSSVIKDVTEPTACIDNRNEISIKTFEKAGWIPTGRVFDWKGNRKAIEYRI